MKRRVVKWLAIGCALVLSAAVAATFVHADRYRGSLQSSLSTALGRKVSIGGHVSFSLFSGPALAVDDVVIAEANEASEPFAYVEEVRAIPRILSLWTGHLEFSSLTLEGAHVNLVRYGTGTTPSWNFEPLLRPGLLAAFPTIHMRESRINFVLEGRKSPFYLLDADLDVNPRSSDGSDWGVRFAGAPARSDRPAHGFGAVEAKGNWKRTGDRNGLLAMDLKLERSEMSDILALLYGRDAGIHGVISGQAHVAGPMSAIGIEGELRVSEIHGWDQSSPASGVFPFRVSGTLNTPAERLELFAQPRGKQPEWMLHVVAESYLESPLLKMDFHSDGFSIAPLPALLHNFGAKLPEGLELTGTVNGTVAFDSREGWTGSARIPEATLATRGSTPLTLQQCAFALDGSYATAGPVEISSGEDAIAEASAGYSTRDGAFEVKLVSREAPLGTLLEQFPGASIPFLSEVHSGSWTGELTYSQPAGAVGAWHGEGELTDATARVLALAQPIAIGHGHLRIENNDIQLDHLATTVGSFEANGDYKYSGGAATPHEFHLVLPRADIAGLEALLHPLLNHGGSLIDRALGRSSVPLWLLDMRAAGTLQVDTLEGAGSDLSRLRANVTWAGDRVAITGLVLHNGKATLSGLLDVDLTNPQPHYSGSGNWSNVPWKEGSVSGTVEQFETSGSGLETLTNLKANGELIGKNLDLAPLGQVDRMTGIYSVSWSGLGLRFRFPSLRLNGDSGEVWTGSGGAQGTEMEVTLQPAGGRRVTLAGSLTDTTKDWVER